MNFLYVIVLSVTYKVYVEIHVFKKMFWGFTPGFPFGWVGNKVVLFWCLCSLSPSNILGGDYLHLYLVKNKLFLFWCLSSMLLQ